LIMSKTNQSVCVRCGKARIVLSVSEETIGTSVVTTTMTVCPDPECQKKVDAMLSAEKNQRRITGLEKEAREKLRKAGRKTDIKLGKTS
jgi:hypothetical protein